MLLRICCVLAFFDVATSLANIRASRNKLIDRRKSPALWRNDLVNQPGRDSVGDGLPFQPVRSEVMAPAGGWPQLKAAVGNGADAVYLGLSAFSARARAANFDVHTELVDAVNYCHAAGVKVYVALNTLVFDSELEEVSELIQLAYKAGVDALIVQDLGVATLANTVAPALPIHSSTQQTVTSSDGVNFCQDQHKATRVVLSRELSVTEIQKVASMARVEVEAFVHGALCVSYSGQCFSSEAWGGRSANRGQCAQACRLPYGLIVDGELRDLQDMAYLLSPQDLCGLDQVPELMKAGVSCLKIEGRLKDEYYVAATTRAYRNAVDRAWKELTGGPPVRSVAPEVVTKQELRQLFSRGQDETHQGLTPGFFEGSQHQMVVRGRSPRHRGVHAGRVCEGSSPNKGLVITTTNAELKLGDGIVVDRGLAEEQEIGGQIFQLERLSTDKVLVKFNRDVMKKWKKADDFALKGMGSRRPLAPVDAHVWRTSDATVEKKMRRLSEAVPPRQGVRLRVSGKIGEPIVVSISDGRAVVHGESSEALQAAEKAKMNPDKILKAIGTLGNTKWVLEGEVDLVELDQAAWCPMSRIKEARRNAVERWERLQGIMNHEPPPSSPVQHGVSQKLISQKMLDGPATTEEKRTTMFLSVLARRIEQVEAVCEMIESGGAVDEVIVDFLEIDGMRDAVSRIRKTGGDVRVVVASPRIIKPGESGIWRTLLRLEPDGLLVRSAGLLQRMKSLGGTGSRVNIGFETEDWVPIPELYGDFSFNVANALTALELLDSGLQRVATTYDLNANAIADLATLMGEKAKRIEVIAHAKLPIFHTEHCVFARFLSKGNSYLDCGHACTRHNVHLRDRTGHDNLVLADMGCRNTVFSSHAQSGVFSIDEWRRAGIGRIRVELVDENEEDTETIVAGYLGVVNGKGSPSKVWSALDNVKDSNGRVAGVSLGSFSNKVERRAGEL